MCLDGCVNLHTWFLSHSTQTADFGISHFFANSCLFFSIALEELKAKCVSLKTDRAGWRIETVVLMKLALSSQRAGDSAIAGTARAWWRYARVNSEDVLSPPAMLYSVYVHASHTHTPYN